MGKQAIAFFEPCFYQLWNDPFSSTTGFKLIININPVGFLYENNRNEILRLNVITDMIKVNKIKIIFSYRNHTASKANTMLINKKVNILFLKYFNIYKKNQIKIFSINIQFIPDIHYYGMLVTHHLLVALILRTL